MSRFRIASTVVNRRLHSLSPARIGDRGSMSVIGDVTPIASSTKVCPYSRKREMASFTTFECVTGPM